MTHLSHFRRSHLFQPTSFITCLCNQGKAFHSDTPGAEAPNAILVAVPSPADETWSTDGLVATLDETLDMAAWRGVDGALLEDLAQLAPAVYLAANAADDTISLDFSSSIVFDTNARLEVR